MTIRALSWLAAFLILAAAFILVVHLSANNMEFSRYNPGWNGTSSFFFDLDRHRMADIVAPSDLLDQPGNATLLIIAPYRHPSKDELAAYTDFLNNGNTIVIADDFGTGSDILAGLSSPVTILPGNLSSLDRRYADPWSVVAYRATETGPLSLPPDIALNHPAALDGGTPLMVSSVMSWNDANGDKRYTMGEEMGTFPVLVSAESGNGRIVVLSDPSIFINAMYTQPENANNRLFISGLVGGDNRILIDSMNSRTANTTGFSEVLHVLRSTVSVQILLIGILMTGLAFAWRRRML